MIKDKFSDMDYKSNYSTKHKKRLMEKLVTNNHKDRVFKDMYAVEFNLDKMSQEDLDKLERLNKLEVDSVIRYYEDNELFLIKMFCIDNETGKRMMVIKSLSTGDVLSVHVDKAIQELTDEDKEKYRQDFVYDLMVFDC